mgnify:CR=1 FL=1
MVEALAAMSRRKSSGGFSPQWRRLAVTQFLMSPASIHFIGR